MEIQEALAQLRREIDRINFVIASLEELTRQRTPRDHRRPKRSRATQDMGQQTQNGLNRSTSRSASASSMS
jgi:hypothetical protein